MGRVFGASLTAVSAYPITTEEHPKSDGTSLWVLCVASMALVLLGGAFAGLTIAYVFKESLSRQPTLIFSLQFDGPG